MRKLAAVLVVLTMIAVALPAPAVAASPSQAAVWLRSDGSWSIGPAPRAGADGTFSCSGVAPQKNSCHLDLGPIPGGWLIGEDISPSTGLLEYSLEFTLQGSQGGRLVFECDLATVNDVFLPFLQFRCMVAQSQGSLAGDVTLDIHVGLWDPRVFVPLVGPLLPSVNGIEKGMGPWDVTAITY